VIDGRTSPESATPTVEGVIHIDSGEATRTAASPRPRQWILLIAPALLLGSILAGSLLILLVYSLFGFERGAMVERPGLGTWIAVLNDSFFWQTLRNTLVMAFTVTIASLIAGYPIAYAISKIKWPALVAVLYVVFFTPLLIGIVVRSYGWILLLADQGVINATLLRLGAIERPIPLIFNLTGVEIALVHGSLSMMVFPLINSFRAVERVLKESAMDLGAGRLQTFRRITMPLSLPGVIAGSQIVFTLAVSAWVTPQLLGGGKVTTMARLAYEDVISLNWPRGAIEVFALLMSALTLIIALNVLAQTTYLGRTRLRH